MAGTIATPIIAVSIGRQGRLYHAYVTTAPAALDAPSTVTLYEARLADVAGLAADPIVVPREQVAVAARLVLIDATELGWHRTRYRSGDHVFVPADPHLVGLNSLQHWLWQRLQSAPRADAHATH
jgi:hypothetical protein